HKLDAFTEAFKNEELTGDFVAVLPFQGAKANGMPELHKLTPYLGVLQNRGQRVALLTDGRMSGASGKVLAAIQITPEAACGGEIARIQDGDIIEIDADRGLLQVAVDAAAWSKRQMLAPDLTHNHNGMGRELFAAFRHSVNGAEQGASIFGGS
ncbi:MAG: phosphogluconate dehydratase, partial [Pseudomonadales bacterium]|nr:phosphogluconate dehydratase [Pseudomonadales bacterium]